MLSSLGIAYLTYVVGTASPGPANLAIIRDALRYGRMGGMATALGVVVGSVMWGLVSALGLGALISKWPDLLNIMSVLGGCYLLWLAWRSLKAAIKNDQASLGDQETIKTVRYRKQFFSGLGLHLTNPKAMFVWMSIIALGLPSDTKGLLLPLLIVAGCGILGILVFCSYAFVFSIPAMMQGYIRATRPINAVIVVLFSAAGLSLLNRSADHFFN